MNKSIQTNYSYLGNLFIEEEGDIGICDGKDLPIKEGKINIVNKNLQTAKYLNLKDYSGEDLFGVLKRAFSSKPFQLYG